MFQVHLTIKENISPSNLGSFSQTLKKRGMESQRGTTLEGPKSSPSSKGVETIALACSQLLCTSAASPVFKYPGL